MSTSAALLEPIERVDGSSKAAMVDLRGRLSNPEIRTVLDGIIQVMHGPSGAGHSTRAMPYRRWRVADRLGPPAPPPNLQPVSSQLASASADIV